MVHGAYWYAGESGPPIGFTSMKEFLTKTPPTEAETLRLLAFFKAAQANPERLDRQAIKATLQETPALRPLARVLPHDNGELYAFLTLIISMLGAFGNATIRATRAIRRKRLKQARANRGAEEARKRETKDEADRRKKRRERIARRIAREIKAKRGQERESLAPRKIWKDRSSS